MQEFRRHRFFILLFASVNLWIALAGCTLKFNDISVPEDIKTIRIQQFDNQAAYINPQLSPALTDRLRQKINSQTKLTQTNNENAHMNITGFIREYSVTTTGISTTNGQRQTSVNRLTVSVQVVVTKPNDTGQPEEILVSRSFDFGANQSLQAAESQLLDEMVRNLTDEIFNRIFSKW